MNRTRMWLVKLAPVLVLLIMAAGAFQPAQADWTGQKAKAADNPEWDKYAFDLPYADGSGRLSFKDLASSGQPFVVVWWLTDCPVCHLQLPYVEQLKQQVDDHGIDLRVVSICVDEAENECLDYVEDKGISFEVLFDQHARKTDSKYHVEDLGTPLTYVFDGGGEFVDYLTGFRSEYAKSVYKLLKITPPQQSRKGK